MKILLILFLYFTFASGQKYNSECQEFRSFTTCINSMERRCIWDQVQKYCQESQEFMLGCYRNLNRLACVSQIGDDQGNFAKCRFIFQCEQIPDVEEEKCENNLSKHGCLSITNPLQVCFWENGHCVLLDNDNMSHIQKNFDEKLYSQSACSYIDHFLIMHHFTIWHLFNYTPNLMQDDDVIFLNDFGIRGEIIKEYDDPTSISLQNSVVKSDGQFEWYTTRESKSIAPRNLKLNDRYREGCIALEIENDSDFQIIFSLKDQVTGINRIYCQYLNRMLSTDPFYIFFKGKCLLFNKELLFDQNKIKDFNLNCYSFNANYCIYFYSIQQNCQIFGDNFEYPCQPLGSTEIEDCYKSRCTAKQCKQQKNYYIDDSHNCSNKCYLKVLQADCVAEPSCIFLGNALKQSQVVCSPKGLCDQYGISFQSCKYLRAKCQWNETLEICFTLQDEELQFLKCSDIINFYACTFITLSDQLCFWSDLYEKCLNKLDQPILVPYQYIIDHVFLGSYYDSPEIWTLCNENLCKSNQVFNTYYSQSSRQCQFSGVTGLYDLTIINKDACLFLFQGFCLWNQHYLTCECHSESYFKQNQCIDLVDINEKCCQFAQVSSNELICTFDKRKNSCKEIEFINLEKLECGGNGLSVDQCLKKSMCRFQAYLCEKLASDYINQFTCQSFHLINQDICKSHNKNNEPCDFNEKQQSCYNPSSLDKIKYNKNLNRYACQNVQDLPTYYDLLINTCVLLNSPNEELYKKLQCEGNFLNQLGCGLIETTGQICYWQETCKLYNNINFSYCSDYHDQGERLCKGLVRNTSNILIKECFCSFVENECRSISETLEGCGENEKMNINRCNSLTGLDQNYNPIQMCAFINLQCVSLYENSSETKLILKEITCDQANLATCQKVETVGQFCIKVTNNSSSYLIFDQKCKSVNFSSPTCAQLSQYQQSNINKNFCSQAIDACLYDEQYGCQQPNTTYLNCESQGISKSSCLNNTKYRRCSFFDNQCQYLPENQQLTDCSILNDFICNSFKYQQCIWKGSQCILDESKVNISKFTCSRDENQQLIIYQNFSCISLLENDLQQYSCEQEGLNRFTCFKLKKQYCIFVQNQCQFYKKILCDDNPNDCKNNNTGNQNCVLKNSKCFHLQQVTSYDCYEFEETNYNFCYNFPNCIYDGQQCIAQKYQYYEYCGSYDDLITCVFHNDKCACQYNSITKKCEKAENIKQCPQFFGYYSSNACARIIDCNYGHTKAGKGFCFSGNILNITCEQLPLEFCMEDIAHLNPNLYCYYDGSCKSLEILNQNCQFLSQYQSNYSACKTVQNVQECFYSHLDNFCKLTRQYISEICSGQTKIQCSLVQNICYYDGLNCVSDGVVQQLNKFGCLQQKGYWRFQNYSCQQLSDDSIVESCGFISQNACLSVVTRELFCRWINDSCEQILEHEGKLIDNCLNLNERACLNIRLSNIQCIWNSIMNNCQQRFIHSEDCSYQSSVQVSLSLCGKQIGKPCIRNENGTSCELFSIMIQDCTKYGLNEIGCIQNTLGLCQWKKINNGGFCDEINPYTVECKQGLNKAACMNVQSKNQFCFWDESTNQCQDKVLSNCESASNLNGKYPCVSVTQDQCMYNIITNQCISLPQLPSQCLNIYNKVTCLQIDHCDWQKNECVTIQVYSCNQMFNKKFCLHSNLLCKWQENQCVKFSITEPKIHCQDIPFFSVSEGVCIQKSLDPCHYDYEKDQCSPSQIESQYSNFDDILAEQDAKFVSVILSGECNQFLDVQDCISARKPNQSCIWNGNNCQSIQGQNSVSCRDDLNIFGCLNITKRKNYCMWQGKCFDWDILRDKQTNVNVNVCKDFSFSTVYRNHSCFPVEIDQILCEDQGIGKATCLSLTKQQCKWIEEDQICVKFEHANEKLCSDYQQVSPYVCQKLVTDRCIFNKETSNCTNAPFNSLIEGISIQACLQNEKQQVYWDGEICQQSTALEECKNQKQVNYLSCALRIRQPCKYNKTLQICTSEINIQSLRCSTLGLNLIGCVSVQSEPCIFFEGQCKLFNDINSPCNKLVNVNEKVCSSIQSEKCEYNEIEYSCQSPQIRNENCNVKGINQIQCKSNDICSWNEDYKICTCLQNKTISQCQLEKEECLKNQNCIYANLQCRLKQCFDLKQENCSNQMFAGAVCYVDDNNECQPAIKCEDIINSSLSCNSIYINKMQCIQGINQCFSYNNYEQVCPLSNCFQDQCISQYGICRVKQCSDYESYECNGQDGCFLNANKNCSELSSCFQINENELGRNAAQICNSVIKNGINCNWQQKSIADEYKKVCTNNYCSFYGESLELCEGNEINSVSCILKNKLICQSCEEISEECYCNKFKNICNFEKGKCNSILCSFFKNQDQCQSTFPRCYWSERVENGTCLINCPKIFNIDECNERLNECHYDYFAQICKNGLKIEIDISIDIQIQQILGQFQMGIFIYFLIFGE